MQKMRDHATMFGATFVQKNVDSIDTSASPFKISVGGEEYFAKSIIIATGAETKWLDAPGLSKLIGRGVSSCAPCDAPFFKNKKVAVVGGGDSAMEEALVLVKYATEVTILHRRDEFRASKAMQEKVLSDPKIKVLWNTEVIKVNGESRIENLELKNNITNETSNFTVDGLFVAIGHTPMSMVFEGKIELDDKGYVISHDGTKTNVPGIFVAGDVTDFHYKQAITAAGFGCMAGIDCLNYLQDKK
jgi:thioredoxin reductase (NADPH)